MKIPVINNVLNENNALAEQTQNFLHENRIRTINFLSSPGAGKTTLMEETLKRSNQWGVLPSVIVGDIATDLDAERINRWGRPAVQINTDGGCHLDAKQIQNVLKTGFMEDDTNLLLIENVGNLVCPASYWLGEDLRVVLLSIPEGDDKPIKYPSTFSRTDIVLITKWDLMEHMDFNLDRVCKDLKNQNPEIQILTISCKSGEGLEEWMQFLRGWLNSQGCVG